MVQVLDVVKGSRTSVNVGITLPSKLVRQIDKARSLISRSTFISMAVEKYLGEKTV
jgi:metal-responsive CopG/Arc/MetJ family transcriptional regulator